MKFNTNPIKPIASSLLLLLSIATMSGVAAESEDAKSRAIASAMQAMDQFMIGFNKRDMEAWADSLNFPHVRFASGTVTVWQTREEFVADNVFARLSATGWDHSHWLERDVTLASPGKVHIATVFQRFNTDNEIIGTYQSLYIVTEVDGHWGTQARSSLAP